MTQKIYPRSPYLILGGYIHLPRLIDKARLSRQGSLHGYNYKTLGFDKHLLSFLASMETSLKTPLTISRATKRSWTGSTPVVCSTLNRRSQLGTKDRPKNDRTIPRS